MTCFILIWKRVNEPSIGNKIAVNDVIRFDYDQVIPLSWAFCAAVRTRIILNTDIIVMIERWKKDEEK